MDIKTKVIQIASIARQYELLSKDNRLESKTLDDSQCIPMFALDIMFEKSEYHTYQINI